MNELTKISELKAQLLLQGREDDVALWWIVTLVKKEFGNVGSGKVRQITINLIRDLLETGLAQAGFPAPDGKGFNAWSGTLSDVLSRIESEWAALGRDPSPAEIVWLRITEEPPQ